MEVRLSEAETKWKQPQICAATHMEAIDLENEIVRLTSRIILSLISPYFKAAVSML